MSNPDDPNLGFQGVNGQETVTGEWAVSLTFGGGGQQGGGGLATVAIVIPYEAVLVREN